MDPTTINNLISENRLGEALDLLNKSLAHTPDSAESLFNRGRVYWRLGRRSDAITDYEAAVAIDPSSPAAIALDQARSIMDFFNPDLYNP